MTAGRDGSQFRVELTDTCGSSMSSAAVVALAEEVIVTEQPDPLAVCEGNPVTFGITTNLTEGLAYQWRKDGVEIPGATADSYTILAAIAAHEGTYDVVVSNICGQVASAGAVLTVRANLTVGSDPADLSLCIGDGGDNLFYP